MKKRVKPRPVVRALEEARYGPEGLLNLRDSMPTEAQATARAEAWLRERQVLGIQEAVIITGRGAGSPGGVAVVREGVRKVLSLLRRRGVVDEFRENGPGSFLVTIAPLRRMLDAPRRHRDLRRAPATAAPLSGELAAALAGLGTESRVLLRRLAELSLAALGVPLSETFVSHEMLRQFTLLAASIPDGPGKEQTLLEAARRAVAEFEEG